MDTYGWDVVVACAVERLNALLKLQFTSTPATLSYSDPSSQTTLQATFDPWRIVAGGSDRKLHIEMPIKTGSLDSPFVSAKLDGVVVLASVELDFVSNAAGTASNLTFNFSSVASQAGDPTKGSIYIVNPDTSGVLLKQDPTKTAATALHDFIPLCLIASKASLNYVFTTLNLTPAGAGSWLTPHSPAYVFVAGSGGTAGYLAVLSMVSAAAAVPSARDVDPGLCTANSDIAIAYAGPVFLQNVIMGQLPSSFTGAIAQNFQMSGGKINNNGPLLCKPVRWGLTDYTPVLVSMVVGISASNITSAATGIFDITGLKDSYVTFSASVSLSCSYDAASGKLSLTPTAAPVTNHDTHIPWWIYVLAAPAMLTVAGPIVIVIVDAVIGGVTASVSNSVSNNAGNLALGDWSAQAIVFPGADKWSVTEAALSDAFYMRCNLHS
ncbi:TULIP family P47-like protein [Aestuariivirga sp.]|uniref:TULIP family P47-like protein n=1 Tax=Aestuariivirga sp. TaxID=2650926 RepID=UPI003593E9A6